MAFSHDVTIVGGCGHVGLPLGIAFAEAGLRVILFDIDPESVDRVRAGKMPFDERGADDALARAIAAKRLEATIEPSAISESEHVIVVVGTPVNEHLDPNPNTV